MFAIGTEDRSNDSKVNAESESSELPNNTSEENFGLVAVEEQQEHAGETVNNKGKAKNKHEKNNGIKNKGYYL